jgi:CheY-like chemotaxis protein
MHALIVDEDRGRRETLQKHLQAASYRVSLATTQAAALQALEREPADVLILNWNDAASDIVRRVRAQDNDRYTFVIATLDKQPPAIIPALILAGADDFLRVPVSREELMARVEAPARFRKWAGIAATHRTLDLGSERDLLALHAFRNMGELVREDLSGLLGPLEVADGFLVSGKLEGASIPMSVAGERAEIRVSILVEECLVPKLAGLLLFDPAAPAAAVKDMIREMANTAGGAVKRSALLENLDITTGIPVDEARAVVSDMARCWTLTMGGCGARIGLVGEVVRKVNQRMALGDAREGMVVAHDLRTEMGVLIMPAGTRLTASSIERAVGFLGRRFVADVMQSA